MHAVESAASTWINLNHPGHYLHWNVFTISVANLIVIAVMLAIFFAALLLPFPGSTRPATAQEIAADAPTLGPAAGGRSRSWTGRLRAAGVRWLPPEKLLPETQPSYVASWVYVFGVASLAALGLVIGSGFVLALGGPDWWHTNAVGHFVNGVHLWSVELFMAFLVIHLWGKFFMASWRGKRARTWITGVLAFLASIAEAFTGYLSQQNFDSQWIATNGKDAFNAAGIGGFFQVMNFGQMLLWHAVLLPLLLLGLVGLHILLVRHRGVAHPFPARRGRDALGRPAAAAATPPRRAELRAQEAAEWAGPRRRYDIIREGVAAIAVVVAVTAALAGVLSSPDVSAITVKQWAAATPDDFVGTAASELAGSSLTATYGPPFNHGSAAVQRIGFSWQTLAGVRTPIDPAQTFVLGPLSRLSPGNPALTAALAAYQSAPAAQQAQWATAYATAAAKATVTGQTVTVAPGSYGPVPTLITAELALAQSGGLDSDLIAQHSFYGTNFTKPLLFLEDGGYYADQGKAQNLQGNQWGVMNETGSYPGQPWLWLYQLWYRLPHLRDSTNVDLIAIYLTGAASLLLLLIPFIPGLRSIPRLVPVYRLIWRRYYREAESLGPPAQARRPGRAPAWPHVPHRRKGTGAAAGPAAPTGTGDTRQP